MTDQRYPIGKYVPVPFSEQQLKEWLLDIQALPGLLEQSILNLDEAQLDTPYREGGWTVKQVVHHVPDSHLNAYIRFKTGLTETEPTIKPYDEAAWAELPDTRDCPINVSLTLTHALHARWYVVLANMQKADWERTVYHPEHKKTFTLWVLLGMYAWHGKHHVAHINSLRERKGW